MFFVRKEIQGKELHMVRWTPKRNLILLQTKRDGYKKKGRLTQLTKNRESVSHIKPGDYNICDTGQNCSSRPKICRYFTFRKLCSISEQHFERLFQFARRIEDLMYTITSEEIPFQLGLSKMDLRKVVKSSLSAVDRSISVMYKRLQKNLTSEELLPSLWGKCKEFLDKYESLAQLVANIYLNESVPAVSEMRELLVSM